MTTYFQDPYTGSNNATWNSSNFTNLASTTSASATIQSNKGRQNAGTDTGYSGKRIDRYAGSNHADLEWVGKFTIVNSVDGHIEMWIRASTTAYDGTGYFLQIAAGSSNNVKISKGVSYSYTDLSTASATVTVGTQYGIRFYAVGTTLKAKIWDASGSEPGAYTLSTTDSSVAAAGYAYLGCNGGGSASFQVDWDDVSLTDGTGNAFTFTASCTGAGALTKPLITKNPFTGSSTSSGVLTKLKVVTKTVTGVITATGNFIKVPQKYLTASITPTGESLKQLFRTYASSITSSGAFRKAGVRLMTSSITATGVFAGNFIGRIFGRPGIARVVASKAAQAVIRIRRT